MKMQNITIENNNIDNQNNEKNVEITRQYNYWRFRLTYALILGYAAYYLLRQNFSIAAPKMDMNLTNVGWAFSGFSLIYGVFKFVSGAVCDRTSARYFMPIGLFCASICNLIIGFTESAVLMGVMWVLNACFQSMGWPSVTRSLTQWFGPKDLGKRWGIVNGSHQIGSVLILMGGAWLVEHYNWRYAFIFPSVICFIVSFIVFERLRDTPESLGLPSLEDYENLEKTKKEKTIDSEGHISFKNMIVNHILFNGRLWISCASNFFVYFVRMGFFCWAPTIILKTKGVSLASAGFKTSILEFMGIFGGIFVGWVTDKFMSDRRGLCGFFMMIGLAITISVYWMFPTQNQWIDGIYWSLIGFFIYGPQTLTGLSSAEFGSKKAAAAATGLNGTIGYLGGTVVGVSVPWIGQKWGWDQVYMLFIITSILGGILFWLSSLNFKPKHRKHKTQNA